MRKFPLLPLLVLLLFSGSLVAAKAQVTRLQAREAEWKSYALPKTNFKRQVNPEKTFVYRVPADWEQQGADLKFKGPHGASLEILIQKVPEGYPLDDYFASMLRTVKDFTGGAGSILTRKTQLQDIEAREICLESPDPEGELIRSTSWITIYGPAALLFNIKTPIAHAAEIEPFLKAVVQSVILVGPDYDSQEELRKTTVTTPASSPIDEIENIVATLNDTTAEREAAVTRLTALFSSTSDVAMDLLLDRRPLVLVATVQAIARSNNPALAPTLWKFIHDREPLVAEAAARALAQTLDIVPKILEKSMSGFNTETIARVWPFLPKEKRNELLQLIFKEPAIYRPNPPPLVIRPGAKPKTTATVVELTPYKSGGAIATFPAIASRDPNVQLGALTLLLTVPRDEFKLPLTQLMASNYDPLIAVGLRVALARTEALPMTHLLLLTSTPDKQVSSLAAQNLALAANVTDIPRLEALISKDGSKKDLDDELKLSIKKINFRHQLASAKTEDERREVTRKALSDTALAEFAWSFSCEATTGGCASNPADLKRDVAIKPFAENLFPKRVKHYTAIPNPRQAVQKFYETLNGLQMDSPRDQSNLVMMLINLRRFFGAELAAPYNADTLVDYTGIDPDSPIVSGAWTAADARDSNAAAQRKAIVLRVKDRARFERLVSKIEYLTGSFTNLTDVAAISTRSIAALPAILPLSAQLVLSPAPTSKQRTGTLLRYEVLADEEWNGLRVRTIRHTSISSSWDIENTTTRIAYLGDVAIVAPDLATIRELVANANGISDKQLVDNAEFRESIASQGDVVYFSDLKAVFAADSNAEKTKIKERGALKFTASSWENSHQFVFAESEWSKPLLPFQPKELTAPRELLPSSTIAYFLTKVDLSALWASSSKDLFSKLELAAFPNFWALDFEKEVLPELGPECGVVLLHPPTFERFSDGTFTAFCKLKSNKLADALTTGKLFRNVGPTPDMAELKLGSDTFFAGARKGFLVISNHPRGVITALDSKTSLAATRDYSRSVEKVPAGVVAFGGYNLEAAIAGVNTSILTGQQKQIADLLFSVTSAFHSQNFYATATAGSISAHSSVAMDREGRYPVADFSDLRRGANITYAVVEPSGVQIADHNRTTSLTLKVRAKAAGPIDNIKDDIKTEDQIVEQKSSTELVVTVAARRAGAEKALQLPVKDALLAEYLKATPEFAADQKEVIDQARQIAGNDRDAWSVARKLADWTHKNLEWKLVASADPVLTLATREADCTEFSALFVGMARSLGLPARTVSGLAYNGSSFGGHAWVEVWIGKWIELDPTWGTSFVDATHVRASGDALLTSAGMNLLELEVLEARRTVAEFQKTPRALAEHLAKAIPASDKPELEAAADIAVLTDTHMGAGAWAKLNDSEREQMWSAYRRLLVEIMSGHTPELETKRIRVLHVEEKGDTAEATCLTEPGELLLKFRFVRRDDVWYFVELVQVDSGLAFASEMLRPAIMTIEKTRAGEKPPAIAMSDYSRVVLLLARDSARALRVADELLQANPKDRGLRYLKARALRGIDKWDEGIKLLTELADEGYTPAVHELAGYLHGLSLGENADKTTAQKSLELYQRYTTLEPRDPRGFRELGHGYKNFGRIAEAEAAYRKAIELDPVDVYNYYSLIELFVLHDRIGEVRPWLVTGEKYQEEEEDLFGMAVRSLTFAGEQTDALEKFVASEPGRMKTSVLANLSLARMFVRTERYVQAERHYNTAALLDKKSTDAHIGLSELYRKQSRWLAALKAANQAIILDAKDSEAYYEKACVLARLGRLKEAVAALTKSIELDGDQAYFIEEEEDLKPLASLPEFKKLLPPPEEPQL
ncbi:MAG TPA: transglutaminase domain-containing protein [Pyrinomonadaceae bacterium]|nr:transglutaminase domain-containing protein [Pyrinomonadaceae bacterium]